MLPQFFLPFRFHRVDYFDMAGQDQSIPQGDQIINEKSAYATKKFRLEGVSMYTDEFPSVDKTQSRSCYSSSSESATSDGILNTNLEKNLVEPKVTDGLILCAKLSGRHEIAVRFKQCDTLAGPKVIYNLNSYKEYYQRVFL